MSGNVVAWVYAHYPVLTEVDRNRKIVLSEVAEAANRDFENAHPGVATISAHWGLGRSTVLRHLAWLVDAGWIEVSVPGGGRGRATVYSVTKTVPMRDGLGNGPNAETVPMDDPKRSHSEPETVPMDGSSPITHPITPLPPPAPTPKERARALAKRLFEERSPKPAQSFVAIVGITERMLNAGHDENALYAAMLAVPTISIGWLEGKLNGPRQRNAKPSAGDKQRLIDEYFNLSVSR